MLALDFYEKSVLGTVLVYPHLQKRMTETLGRYNFQMDIRNLAYEGVKRIKDGERKPSLREWIESITPEDTQNELFENTFYKEINTLTKTLSYKDYKKHKCTKEDLESYLKVCLKQEGIYDIIRFNYILRWLLERKIKSAIAEEYLLMIKGIYERNIEDILNNNDTLVRNIQGWVKEINRRTE